MSIPSNQEVKSLITENFNTNNNSSHLMGSGDIKVGFNMPDALVESSTPHCLPPHRRRKAFLVDEYPGCPQNWTRSEGIQTSYFVPVEEGKGMWLDFNECSKSAYDVAIVISIQGINAITGLPVEDVSLEQYKEECPKHKVKFGPHRFCEQCGHKWPKQNYIATTSTPDGSLWIDGFRSGDGKVRQYLLTEERLKGIANAIVGERRVHAIGISFFLSKSKKPVKQTQYLRTGSSPMSWSKSLGGYKTPSPFGETFTSHPNNDIIYYSDSTSLTSLDLPLKDTDSITATGVFRGRSLATKGAIRSKLTNGIVYGQPQMFSPVNTSNATCQARLNSASFSSSSASSESSVSSASCSSAELAAAQKKLAETANDPDLVITTHHAINLEIGAGAVISQMIHDDPSELDFWRDKPESIIIINYADEQTVRNILSKGKKDLSGSEEGFLANLPIGNPVEDQAEIS